MTAARLLLALVLLPGCFPFGNPDPNAPQLAALDDADRTAHARDPNCIGDIADDARASLESIRSFRNLASLESRVIALGDIDGDGIIERAVRINACNEAGSCQSEYYLYSSNRGCTQQAGQGSFDRLEPVRLPNGRRALYGYVTSRTPADRDQWKWECRIDWFRPDGAKLVRGDPVYCDCQRGVALRDPPDGPGDPRACAPFGSDIDVPSN